MLQKTARQYAMITLGSALYCLAFHALYDPNRIAFGGVTGIAQVIHHLIPVLPVGMLVFALNVPLFLLGWKFLGGHVLLSSLFAMTLTSLGLDLLPRFAVFSPMGDTMLASVFAGALLGLAIGLIFSQGATTGGSDLAARLVKLRLGWLPLGRVLMALDLVVIAAAAAVFREVEAALYGIVALVLSTYVTDLVLYGPDSAKVAYLITDHTQEVLQVLTGQLGRGVTILHGEGAWSGEKKQVLMCAFKQREIVTVKQAVRQLDPDAFLIVCDAREVLGLGFRSHLDTEI